MYADGYRKAVNSGYFSFLTYVAYILLDQMTVSFSCQ